MLRTWHKTARALTAVTAAGALLGGVAPAASAASAGGCLDRAADLTVEEQRLDQAVPQRVLDGTGFDRFVERFTHRLCSVSTSEAAVALMRSQGSRLWDAAVARAQGERPARGELARADDRPLYWARLGITRALRQWDPPFALDQQRRTELLRTFIRASRGQTSIDFPAGDGVDRILVSGFDPFQLDSDIRHSNPAGSVALALDGTVIHTDSGPARVETAMFPVLWKPFERGMVEHTFLPYLKEGKRQVDMFTTVSQGRPGQFDIERYNGRWHEGEDNNRERRRGTIPVPDDVPTVTPAPEFVPTTLPYEAITDADTGRFPVYDNTTVTEIPAGETEPVERPGGPTPGSTARAGSGGSYLSNEVAYRTTLLREAVDADLPGGHVHTPVLKFGPDNDSRVTDPAFERNRRDIVAQTHEIITVAAGTLD